MAPDTPFGEPEMKDTPPFRSLRSAGSIPHGVSRFVFCNEIKVRIVLVGDDAYIVPAAPCGTMECTNAKT